MMSLQPKEFAASAKTLVQATLAALEKCRKQVTAMTTDKTALEVIVVVNVATLTEIGDMIVIMIVPETDL